jgi:hypothetical protein
MIAFGLDRESHKRNPPPLRRTEIESDKAAPFRTSQVILENEGDCTDLQVLNSHATSSLKFLDHEQL